MLKDFPEVQLWIQEGEERGEERGLEKGREEGREEGSLSKSRDLVERLLARRFGALSPASLAFLALRTRDELDVLFERANVASSLSELGIPE